jgi:hypothetical protein
MRARWISWAAVCVVTVPVLLGAMSTIALAGDGLGASPNPSHTDDRLGFGDSWTEPRLGFGDSWNGPAIEISGGSASSTAPESGTDAWGPSLTGLTIVAMGCAAGLAVGAERLRRRRTHTAA